MNGGMTECNICDWDPCRCKEIEDRKKEKRITDGKVVCEVAVDVFSKGSIWKIVAIKWMWPDLKRLSNALYDYWDKS